MLAPPTEAPEGRSVGSLPSRRVARWTFLNHRNCSVYGPQVTLEDHKVGTTGDTSGACTAVSDVIPVIAPFHFSISKKAKPIIISSLQFDAWKTLPQGQR